MNMHCPKCGGHVERMDDVDCWWYECIACGHDLSYEEAVEMERQEFDRWVHKIMSINGMFTEEGY
jgi:hypothetical protein